MWNHDVFLLRGILTIAKGGYVYNVLPFYRARGK